MNRWLAALALLLAIAGPALPSMWEDPGFEDMVGKAELIAVIEVVRDGKFVAEVRALEVLKGADPGRPFLMGDYNDQNWPERGIEKESLKKGERLLVFLHRARLPVATESPDGPGQEPEGWAVPTPSTGDFRIIAGKLHGGWYDPSYPHSRPGVDAGLALGLLRGYLDHLRSGAGGKAVEARKLIASKLTVDLVRSLPPVPAAVEEEGEADLEWRGEDSASGALATLDWLLCAQAAYGGRDLEPVMLEAARSRHAVLQVLAAHALRSAETSRIVREALGDLLLERHSFIQAAAARTLAAGGFPREDVLPLLLKSLPSSSGDEGRPRRVMDPLLNRNASGREVMIRALTGLAAAREAHDELVKLIRDEGLTEGVFGALADHFVKHPSVPAREKFFELYRRCPEDAARHFHRYFFREKSPEALREMGERIAKGDLEIFEAEKTLWRLAGALPRGDPLYRSWIVKVLNRCLTGGEASPPELIFLPFAVVAAGEETAGVIGKWPETGYREDEGKMVKLIKEAVKLELSPPADVKQRLDRWIDLLARWERLESADYRATDYLFRELVAATAEALRTYAVAELRKPERENQFHALQAIRQLGGKLTEEEEKGLEEYRSGMKRDLEE